MFILFRSPSKRPNPACLPVHHYKTSLEASSTVERDWELQEATVGSNKDSATKVPL